jgi:transposase
MAGWLIPTLKAILPHVSDVVSAVRPVFTRKRTEAVAANPGDLVQQQIAELQAAAAQNADHIKELAAQLQSTVAALESAALTAEARLRRAGVMCAVAMAISVVALFVALAALSLR